VYALTLVHAPLDFHRRERESLSQAREREPLTGKRERERGMLDPHVSVP
jgi:hypothetical protein